MIVMLLFTQRGLPVSLQTYVLAHVSTATSHQAKGTRARLNEWRKFWQRIKNEPTNIDNNSVIIPLNNATAFCT